MTSPGGYGDTNLELVSAVTLPTHMKDWSQARATDVTSDKRRTLWDDAGFHDHLDFVVLSGDSIYDVAMLGVALFKKKAVNQSTWSRAFSWLAAIVQGYLTVTITHALQALFLRHVWNVVVELMRESEGECVTRVDARFACVLVFSMCYYLDFMQAINLVKWNFKIRRSATLQPLEVIEGEDGTKSLIYGMPASLKWMNFFVIILPRFVFSLAVLCMGSAYIAYSGSTEDMILNTLSLFFIVELDKIFFVAFTSRRVATIVEALPKYFYNSKRTVLNDVFETLVVPILLGIGMTGWIMAVEYTYCVSSVFYQCAVADFGTLDCGRS